jgi:hypothetical protein
MTFVPFGAFCSTQMRSVRIDDLLMASSGLSKTPDFRN